MNRPVPPLRSDARGAANQKFLSRALFFPIIFFLSSSIFPEPNEQTKLVQIWRGLWYCMFMCDKAPVQRELAENLAGLLSLFKDDRPEGVRFFKSFCVTMQR